MDALSLIAAEPLDHEADAPLYQQLEQRLLGLIASGALDAETPLPTEMELCEAFGLSRATVRRCFADLVEEGRVVRRRGQGTFVARGQASHAGPFLNFTRRMEAAGLRPSSKVLGLRVTSAPAGVAARLGVEPGTPVHEVRRLRLADGRPMTVDTAYVPQALLDKVPAEEVSGAGSLYALLARRTGTLPARAEERFEAVNLTESEADLFGVGAGTAGFLITRTTFDEHDRPFETSVTLAPGDRNSYELATPGDRGGGAMRAVPR